MRCTLLMALVLFPSLALAQGIGDKPDFDLSSKGSDFKPEKDLGGGFSVGLGSLDKGDAFPKESAPNVDQEGKFKPKDSSGGFFIKKTFP